MMGREEIWQILKRSSLEFLAWVTERGYMVKSFIAIWLKRLVTINVIIVIDRPKSRTNEQATYPTWKMLHTVWKDQIHPLIPIHPYIQIYKYLLHIKFQKMMVQCGKCFVFSNHMVARVYMMNFIAPFRYLSGYVLM